MVNVSLESIQIGSFSQNSGVFSGQNIQNSWDSHTPTIASFGITMGDFCTGHCEIAGLWSQSYSGQAIYDSDSKGNGSQYQMK